MNESAITVRYAKALYQVGEEDKVLEVLKTDIEMLYVCINGSKEFVELLHSPIFKTSKKIKLFTEIFSKHVNPLLINFFNLLAKNKREQYFSSMCLYFLQIYKEKQGIKKAVITTAQVLDSKYREEVLKLLKKKFKLKIELTEEVNSEIIGGFKLRIDDQQIDASISSKLRRIKQELINS